MKDELQSLIDPNLYQVFLMSCRCGLPISFARHHWFVVNNKGKVSRWEVLIEKEVGGTSWGHLHKDLRPAFEALGTLSVSGESWWKPDMLGQIEGGDGSDAQKMVEFIEKSNTTYPFCDKYLLWSPNSNTYVQWVLDRFPQFTHKIPWNGFGKGYKIEV
jgi:hypothetical protein